MGQPSQRLGSPQHITDRAVGNLQAFGNLATAQPIS